jgi:hypothetical protein
MTDTTTETGTELALFPKLNLPSVTGITEEMNRSFGTMYTRIEAGIAELPTDMSIAKNRDAVASYAYSISRTKTGLDAAAKDVAGDAKKIVDAVNDERSQLKSTLDKLRDIARAPLDAWQAAENAKAERAAAKRQELSSLPASCALMSSAELYEAADFIDTPFSKEEYGEEAHNLIALREETRLKLFDMMAAKKKSEDEAAELEQLRAEKAAREEADRIAAEKKAAEEEAAAQAERDRVEAEERAEADRIERERIAQEAKATAAREAQEAIDAEKRKTEEAEAARIAAEEARQQAAAQAEADRIAAAAAAEQAATEREERAAQKVRDEQKAEAARIERERLAKEQADKERAADLAHRKRLNGEAVAGLMKACGLSEKEAQAVVVAIYKEQVPHVSIAY